MPRTDVWAALEYAPKHWGLLGPMLRNGEREQYRPFFRIGKGAKARAETETLEQHLNNREQAIALGKVVTA